MEIHLTPELEEQLRFVARNAEKGAEELAREVLSQVLDERTQMIRDVEEARASYAGGEFYEHEEVLEMIERNFKN